MPSHPLRGLSPGFWLSGMSTRYELAKGVWLHCVLICSTQSHSSNEDTRKKLEKHIENLKSIVESIESRKDKELPDLKKVLERFTVYAP